MNVTASRLGIERGAKLLLRPVGAPHCLRVDCHRDIAKPTNRELCWNRMDLGSQQEKRTCQ